MTEKEQVTTSTQRPPELAAQSEQPVAERTDEERRAAFMERVTLILVIAAIVAILFCVLLYLQTGVWQALSEGGGLALTLVSLIVARGLVRRGKLNAAGYWILFALLVGYGAAELFLASATLYLTVGGILLIIIVDSIFLPRKWGAWLAATGLFVTYAFLVNQFEPLPRYDITQSPVLRIFIPGITVSLALVILWRIGRAFRIGTIRTRLLISFVTMVLLPVAAVSAGSAALGWQSGRQQALNQLESVATLKEAEVETWVSSLQTDLVIALSGQTAMQHVMVLLEIREKPAHPEDYQEAYTELRARFQQIAKPTGQFDELFIMDLWGQVVLSNDTSQEGKIYGYLPYFQEGLKGEHVHPPFKHASLDQVLVFAARPIKDEQGQVLGVMAGRASMARLSEIMLERAGLGQTGETYLVRSSYTMLTKSRFVEKEDIYVRTEGVEAAVGTRGNGYGMYADYRDVPIIGVYHWLPDLQAVLVAEQDQSEALGAIRATLVINVGVALAFVLLAVAASLFATRSIVTPLANLAETATQIAAGDLERVAKAEREDEIGVLAQAFNSMTAQLRGLIGGLEQRVAERTAALTQRSVQLEAAAQVAQEAAAIRDVNQLLNVTVRLISDRFGFYHAGIFLLDERGEYAVLQAASSEGGQRMLARGHKLKVGELGIVGYAAGTGEPRIALDVGADAVFFNNPDLPNTRSEMGLPLSIRERVIGVLDVQSTQEAAFSDEDVAILQTMAGQVALAIENAHLLEESQQALWELEALYGQRVRAAWRERTARQPAAYRYTGVGVESVSPSLMLEMEAPPPSRRPVVVQEEDGRRLIAPIRLRGQTLGSIALRQGPEEELWSDEEITLVEELSTQIGLALENARLLEETRQRAEQERLITDITARVRASMDLESILQTAVRELGTALGTDRAFIRLGVGPQPSEE